VHGGRVLRRLRADLADSRRRMTAAAMQTEARLTAAQREALARVVVEHPAVFHVAALTRLAEHLKHVVTAHNLDRLADVLTAFARSSGSFPRQLRDVVGQHVRADLLYDQWGHPLEYQGEGGGGVRLTAWGRDGRPGGGGLDADIERAVAVPAALGHADCPEPASRLLLGADVLRALVDAQRSTADLVPVAADATCSGLRVVAAPAGTLWAHMGLCRGDVLARAGDAPVCDIAAFLARLERVQSGTELRLRVRRGPRDSELVLAVP
jgi:hypothetical protein